MRSKGIQKRRLLPILISMTLVLVMIPAQAFAATSVNVEDQTYDATTYPSGISGQGSDNGTWTWDGADSMTLTDYEGGHISAAGDLNVTLEGINIITYTDTNDPESATPETPYGLKSDGGDLTISGDSYSGLAVIYDNNQAGSQTCGNGISGDSVTIDGTVITVDLEDPNAANVPEESGAVGIVALGGPVTIRNGADVQTTTVASDLSMGISGSGITTRDSRVEVLAVETQGSGPYGLVSTDGDITITNSTVTADTVGNEGVGILNYPLLSSDHSSIAITNSNVTASGTRAAILALRDTEGGAFPEGRIVLTNSVITTPEGGIVQDIAATAAGQDWYGQTIGTGTGLITSWDSADIARSAVITAVEPVNPVNPDSGGSTQPATAKTSASIPHTGDKGLPATMGFALLLLGGAGLVLAGRRRVFN